MQKYIILIFIISLSMSDEGCTDLFALNYDNSATIDDNSCQYADHIIEAQNFSYTPDYLVVNVGESVQWNNLSGFHDVEVTSGPEMIDLAPVSGPALIGSYTFTISGTYEYECTIGSHASLGQVGTIVVNEAISPCDEGYTFIDSQDIPYSTFVIDQSNCFLDQDIITLQDIISSNNLSTNTVLIGSQVWSQGRLRVLTVGNNDLGGYITLTSLPNSIGNIDGATQLYLDDNQIVMLPESIGQLTNLQYLVLSFNNLTSLPESIGNLNSLSWLDVGYNEIAYIPDTIGNLSNLSYLWIFDNELSAIPDQVCNLNINWSETAPDNDFLPYFGVGGNNLCNSDGIPECIQASEHFPVSLDSFYYAFIIYKNQDCSNFSTADINFDNNINIQDVVVLSNNIFGAPSLNPSINLQSDVNNDTLIDVRDIILIINIILSD
ncbi:MAG: hypothetical protein CMG00_05835 [Candidatus Marinimicrobia bacterium]|nr:hypothetical protein [Candidatus Neomarinimicrobiota bacterium]